VALLGVFMVFLNRDVRATYYGRCNVQIGQGGAGACLDPAGDPFGEDYRAGFCDGGCSCLCAGMALDWAFWGQQLQHAVQRQLRREWRILRAQFGMV